MLVAQGLQNPSIEEDRTAVRGVCHGSYTADSVNWVSLVGVFTIMRALLFGVYIRAPDFLESVTLYQRGQT